MVCLSVAQAFQHSNDSMWENELEFLIVSSPDFDSLSRPLEPGLGSAPSLSPDASALQFYDFGSLFVAASDLAANDICAVGFDGAAVGSGRAFSSATGNVPSVEASAAYLDGAMDLDNESDFRGMFALIRVNPHTKAFTVAVDPLALYPVLICGFGETLIISNNIHLIDEVVQSFGRRLTRSTKALATQLAVGVGNRDRTGFREVSRLPAGKLIAGIGPNWRLIDASPPRLPTAISYQDLLELLESRLLENIEKTCIPGQGPFQVTFGDDLGSRLVLAGLTASGVSDIQLVSPADGDTASVNPSTRLAAQILQKRAEINTLGGIGKEDPLSFLRQAAFQLQGDTLFRPDDFGNETAESCLVLDASADQALFQPLSHPKWGNLFWRHPISSIAKISNSDPVYGACTAAWASGLFNRKRGQAARWLSELMSQNHMPHHLFTRRFLRQSATLALEELERVSLPSGGLNAGFYHQCFMRHQIAMPLRLAASHKPVFSPLLDPVFTLAALRAAHPNADPRVVVLDLIRKLGGDAVLKAPVANMPRSKALDTFLKRQRIGSSKPYRPLKQEGSERSRALYDTIKSEFAALARALPKQSECWQFLDKKHLLKELETDRCFASNERGAQVALQIFQILIWQSSSDLRP